MKRDPTSADPPITTKSLLEALEKLNQIASAQGDIQLLLQEVVKKIREVIGSGVCTLHILRSGNKIKYFAFAGCSEKFGQLLKDQNLKELKSKKKVVFGPDSIEGNVITEIMDLQKVGCEEIDLDFAREYRINSLLAFAIVIDKVLNGYLIYYSENNGPFPQNIRQILNTFSGQISTIFDLFDKRIAAYRYEKITLIMREMTEAEDIERLLSLVLEAGASLVNAPWVSISLLNISKGDLETKIYKGPQQSEDVMIIRDGKGLTNEALRQMKPILVQDVIDPSWNGHYYEFLPDTRSELAVPIVVNNAAVRVGQSIERVIKPVGVINFESPDVGAFSSEDAGLMQSLANYAGVLIEGLETDGKQERVARMKEEILEKADWEGTIEVMLKAIKDTLGYDYVNISLVNPDTNTIKTEFVLGIPSDDLEGFKRIAVHNLDSVDIQAHIVRTRQIEVPAAYDPRFDQKIYERFHHEEMIRVFIPMIAPTDKHVIGTVEAGYRRSEHRRHIFEQDVQILKDFIEYAARALDRRQSWELGKIGHELRSPLVGIRNHASFLQWRIDILKREKINQIIDDILSDCEIALSIVAQLEYYLGKPLPPQKVEQTLVFRDVIIKTIHQLSSLIKGLGLDPERATYSASDMFRIKPIWVDKNMLGQVFFNLMINAIKYSENDPSIFSIHIDVDETRENWLIKVQDWGIGVKPEYKDKIFEEGFRTPEARARNVTGTGLGLTVSHQCMRTLGGDLQITNLSKPTEFTVSLPKSLAKQPKEVSNDSLRG